MLTVVPPTPMPVRWFSGMVGEALAAGGQRIPVVVVGLGGKLVVSVAATSTGAGSRGAVNGLDAISTMIQDR